MYELPVVMTIHYIAEINGAHCLVDHWSGKIHLEQMGNLLSLCKNIVGTCSVHVVIRIFLKKNIGKVSWRSKHDSSIVCLF